MFGYVKPDYRELKVKEYDLYKSAYCGLCRVMGKRYSYIYKMSLSYDFVFMVLLRLYASPENVSFAKKRCIAHPTKKKVMMEENSALSLASDVGVIMLYHDFLDKINDKDGFKSFICKLVMPEIKRLHKKACKDENISVFDKFVEERLNNLSKIEKDFTPSIDIPSEEFGLILAEALSIGYEGANKRITYEIGKNIGKWIYIIDAVDDIDSDEKNKTYNPFLATFKTADEAKKHGEMILTALLNTLSEADKALSLLDNTDRNVYEILSNIIRLGNTKIQEDILSKNNYLVKNT